MSVSSDDKICWIGAGKMGAPMIKQMLLAGAPVVVSDPSVRALDSVTEKGAVPVQSLAECGDTPVVFSTLPNDDALLAVVCGSDDRPGLENAMASGSVFVDMSTVSPVCSEKVAQILANAQIHYLRAPVSGSTDMAENATLTIFASGDDTAWQIARPYLEVISQKCFYLGLGEEARYMKLVVNTLIGASSSILAEAVSLGVSGGLSREDIMEVVCESAAASPLLNYKKHNVVQNDYEPAFTIDQMIKDFTLISDAARAKEVPLLTNGLILEQYRAAANAGLRDKDFFALVKWHEEMSNI